MRCFANTKGESSLFVIHLIDAQVCEWHSVVRSLKSSGQRGPEPVCGQEVQYSVDIRRL